MEPLFLAVRHLKPGYRFQDLDLITDRNSLRKLLRFVTSTADLKDFRINAIRKDKTIVFVRNEKRTVQKSSGFGNNHGLAFEKVSTGSEKGLEKSTGHHRIISYVNSRQGILARAHANHRTLLVCAVWSASKSMLVFGHLKLYCLPLMPIQHTTFFLLSKAWAHISKLLLRSTLSVDWCPNDRFSSSRHEPRTAQIPLGSQSGMGSCFSLKHPIYTSACTTSILLRKLTSCLSQKLDQKPILKSMLRFGSCANSWTTYWPLCCLGQKIRLC